MDRGSGCRVRAPVAGFWWVPLAGLGLAVAAQLVWVFAHRIGYPLDLEWMEGGMLVHALRVERGECLYCAPSVDFVSFLYTPLYPALLAVLAKIVPLGYVLGRAVSLAGFAAGCAALLAAAWRRSPGPVGITAGLLGLGAVAVAFPFCGAWYDLVRNDSLWLGLMAWSLFFLVEGDSLWSLGVAALAAALALLTKQTAAPMILAGSVAVAVLGRPLRGLGFLLGGGGLSALALWVGNRATGGWMWVYVYQLHQAHETYWIRVWRQTPLELLRYEWALLLVPALWGVWALRRRQWDPRTAAWTLLAGAGILVSAGGSATQGAYLNARIPGVFFVALAASVAAAALGGRRPSRTRVARWQADAPATLLAALGLLAGQVLAHSYDPKPHVPDPGQWEAAWNFLDRLRDLGPRVFVPYHPWYNVLAGGPGHLHIQGVSDVSDWVRRPVTGDPRRDAVLRRRAREEIRRSFLEHRWSAVLHDRRYTWQLPGLRAAYRLVGDLGPSVPRTFTGNPCAPRYLWVPRKRRAPNASRRREKKLVK